MSGIINPQGFPLQKGINLAKSFVYGIADLAASVVGYAMAWADTFKDSAGINAGASSGYTRRGTPNFDVIRNTNSPVSLLLHLNDTGKTDSSSYGRTLTLSGNSTISTAQKKFGNSSAYFDGSGDYIRAPQSADFNISSSFTVDAWVRFEVSATSKRVWFIHESASRFMSLETTGGDKLWFYLTYGGTTNTITSSTTLLVNTWYHVAIVRNGNNFKMYLNGTEEGSTFSYSGSMPSMDANGFRFGGENSYGVYMRGWIDEMRFSNNARWTANFTAPSSAYSSDANTILLCHFDMLFTDSSSYAHTVSLNGGAVISDAQEKFGDASLLLDNSISSYLSVPIHDSFKFGTGNFCVDLWVRPVSLGSGEYVIMSYSPGDYVDFGIYLSSSGITVYINDASALTYTTPLSTGSWQHVALTREGTSLRLFVDGVLVQSATNSGDIQGTGAIEIGKEYDGYADEIRITKGAARYTATFTPPSVEGTAEAAGDVTVISVTNTLDEAIDSAMVFADYTLNTGTINFFISTDGGSAWTAVTLEEIMTVPAGNDICLKAEITGDAELEFWGYAV